MEIDSDGVIRLSGKLCVADIDRDELFLRNSINEYIKHPGSAIMCYDLMKYY